ncbi:MAG: ribose 5-phosphate isomerase B [Acidimicrobiia bacterium]|nr:ribose 5-phosphate isomerase B [Acidimicrobiia bacterium]
MAPSEAEIRDVVRQVVAGYTRSSPPLTATSATPPAFSSPSRSEIGTIAVGADHGGYALKERIAFRLRESGREVIDCGTDSTESVDYPDFAHAVASRVASGEAASGIIIDGAGIGSAMVANKVPGVRAALCYDISSARNSREHNHANVLTLGAGLIGSSLAQQIVETWLETPWGPGRHADRVAKINAIEHRYTATSAIGTTRT